MHSSSIIPNPTPTATPTMKEKTMRKSHFAREIEAAKNASGYDDAKTCQGLAIHFAEIYVWSALPDIAKSFVAKHAPWHAIIHSEEDSISDDDLIVAADAEPFCAIASYPERMAKIYPTLITYMADCTDDHYLRYYDSDELNFLRESPSTVEIMVRCMPRFALRYISNFLDPETFEDLARQHPDIAAVIDD